MGLNPLDCTKQASDFGETLPGLAHKISSGYASHQNKILLTLDFRSSEYDCVCSLSSTGLLEFGSISVRLTISMDSAGHCSVLRTVL